MFLLLGERKKAMARRYFLCVFLAVVFLVLIGFSCDSEGDDDDDAEETDDDSASSPDDDGGEDFQATDPAEECKALEPGESGEPEAHEACRNCVIQCNLARQSSYDLTDGPCLSEAIIEGWACDVVHSPRLPVDDLPANQCAQYPDIAPHLVEVSPSCHFIRAP